MVEIVRTQLHECIDNYGLSDSRTIDKSQELDNVINEEFMHQDVIKALKELIDDRKVFVDKEDPLCPFRNDVENLEKAVQLIKDKDKSDKEAVYFMILCKHAAEILKEVKPFCQYLHRKDIDDFLEKIVEI